MHAPANFPRSSTRPSASQARRDLEEYVGYGFGMTLKVTEEDGALVFRSERYFFEVSRLRLQIPRFAEPGAMEIVHRDEGGGQFSFRLTLEHRLAGKLMHQLAYFRDP